MLVYLLLLIAIGLTVSGQVLLKLGMNRVRSDMGAFSANLRRGAGARSPNGA